MNSFDENFYKKFIPEWQEILYVLHSHPILVIKKLFVVIVLFLIIPICFYYYSPTIHTKIPFYYFERYLFFLYFKIIYDLLNWYNDSWIITDSSVIALDWSIWKTKTESINFENIEWLWVEENWFLDKILKKWTLVIHKEWDEEFILEECINPYKAIDLIEEISSEDEQEEEKTNLTDERFNKILETLSDVIWEWVKPENKKNLNLDIVSFEEKEKIKKEIIEKAEKTEWTIDLR